MNKDRRARIQALINKLEDIKEDIDFIKDEEQEYYDNMPENFQMGEKGDKAQEAIDNLDYAYSSIEEVVEYLEEALE
jgi:uncharacterized coiled-coil DUF342 family protein